MSDNPALACVRRVWLEDGEATDERAGDLMLPLAETTEVAWLEVVPCLWMAMAFRGERRLCSQGGREKGKGNSVGKANGQPAE